MTKSVFDVMKAARARGVPLIAVATADQHAFVRACVERFNGETPYFEWDCQRGIAGLSATASKFLATVDETDRDASPNPMQMIGLADKLPGVKGNFPASILFCHNAVRFFDEAPFVQGISNLRDSYKQDGRLMVLMGPTISLPPEIRNDVVILEEKLPDDERLAAIVKDVHEAGSVDAPDEKTLTSAVNAVRGLSEFGAEQVVAMSLTKKGLDVEDAWERKKAAVNAVRGLSLQRGGTGFDQLGGIAHIKKFASQLADGRARPDVVVFIDEIEKALAAGGTDTTGVTQDFIGSLLRYMDGDGGKPKSDGMILIGPPGTAKTAFARSFAAEIGSPLVSFDVGGFKDKFVGNSEGNIRSALTIVDGLGKRPFFIATCNRIEALAAELKRRFRSGIWMFAQPTKKEREAIWRIHLKSYDLPMTAKRPNDEGWTGAEIRNACDLAWRLEITPEEAAEYIVPVTVADAAAVQRLYDQADGRFKSAARGGAFTRDELTTEEGEEPKPIRRRRVNVE